MTGDVSPSVRECFDKSADVCPQTPNQMSENLMSVHSRRVIRLTRTGDRVSEWELRPLISHFGRALHGFGRGIGQGHGHELSPLPPANAATARRRISGSFDLSAMSSTACDIFPISPSALNSAWRTSDDVSV